jgi:hypothetical protein
MYASLNLQDSGCMPILLMLEYQPVVGQWMYASLKLLQDSGCMPVRT